MNTKTVIHLCLAGLFALLVLYVMGRWNSPEWEKNPMYALIGILTVAIAGGLFFVLVVLPRIGDAVGTAMLSSGAEVTQDDSMKAAAKMAAGDYTGAIQQYEKIIKDHPEDTFAISEIAKIKADKLQDPAGGIAFLQKHLEGSEWPEDDAAFLMFRLADISSHAEDFDGAKDVLEQIVGNFPGTRHSSNAKHRISELEQLQFKLIQARRAQENAGGNA